MSIIGKKKNVGGDSTYGTSNYWLPKVNMSRITVPTWLPIDQMHPVDYYASWVKNMTGEFTTDQIIKIRQYYYAMCAELDGMLGEIIDALEKSGTANNTYIVFTSDHGDMQMEHRQILKMHYFEGSSRVPLVITGPGVNRSVVTEPTQLIDLFPTFMDIAGIKPPPLLNGTSLMPFLNPSAPTSAPPIRPNYILSQYHGCGVNTSFYMLRTGPYKYIAYGDGYVAPPQLFNLNTDPQELVNLAPRNPDVVSTLDKQLRSIIDYPSVTKEVDAYNRAQLTQFKAQSGANYSTILANLSWFWDWAKNPSGNIQLIQDWVDGKINAQ
jgi:arylsulfatase K